MRLHKDVEAAIARVVAAGGTVKLPLPWDDPTGPLTPQDIDALDERWKPFGVRVREEARSNYFSARVQMLRHKYGMPYHSAYKNHLVFEPEPSTEMAHG